jgi:hypothetical protein
MARINTVASEGQYPFFSQASTNGLTYPVFSAINDAPAQLVPSAPGQLGDVVIDKFGNLYVYVRAGAALAVGQVCKNLAPTTGTVSATGSGGDNLAVINTNITTTVDESQVVAFLSNNSVTNPGIRLIKGHLGNVVGANTQFVISKKQPFFGIGAFDGDKLTVAWVNTDPIAIVRPYTVDVCGVAPDQPVGVALGTVTSGNRTLIQVSGVARANAVGSTDALVAGSLVIPIASGSVKGPLTAGITAAEVAAAVGIARQAYAGAVALQTIQLHNLLDKF